MATATKKTHAAEMLDELVPMLTRLKLTAIRDQPWAARPGGASRAEPA
jgi:hypothetical protein